MPDSATDVPAGDALDSPASMFASFGGGSPGGVVTDDGAGNFAGFGPGISLQLHLRPEVQNEHLQLRQRLYSSRVDDAIARRARST